MSMITSAQCRGARGMLDLSMAQLATSAGVSVSMIKRFEDDGVAAVPSDTIDLISRTMEAAGMTFLPDDGHGIGLRLRRSKKREKPDA